MFMGGRWGEVGSEGKIGIGGVAGGVDGVGNERGKSLRARVFLPPRKKSLTYFFSPCSTKKFQNGEWISPSEAGGWGRRSFVVSQWRWRN